MTLKFGSRGESVKELQGHLNVLAKAGAFKLARNLMIDGVFGRKTGAAVRRFQAAERIEVDGVAGDATLGRIADKLIAHAPRADRAPAVRRVPRVRCRIPRELLEFIIAEEGMDQPWRFPGGKSGVTIGHGYDLGAETEAELRHDWARWLDGEQLDRLAESVGKSGAVAKRLCPRYRDIEINVKAADDVFHRCTVPKYYRQMLRTFPGAERFPGAVQGALLSLVFNRGTSLRGNRRAEMRAIRDLVATGSCDRATLEGIAAQLRSMKRLWQGQGLDGLLLRREREARWVEIA